MRKKTVWIAGGVLATTLIVLVIVLWPKKPAEQKTPYELYGYSVTDGQDEKVNTAVLPAEWLKKDTVTLLANCLRYPQLAEYSGYSSIRQGIELTIWKYPGLQEFMTREDREEAARTIDPDRIVFASERARAAAESFLKDLREYLAGTLDR